MPSDDLKRWKLEHKNEESNLKQILNSAPVGMITLNRSRSICQVNDAALTIMGKQREAVLGKSLGESFDCKGSKIEDKECGKSALCRFCELRLASENAYKSGTSTTDIEINKIIFRNEEEESCWFKASVIPMLTKEEKNVVISIVDITDSKDKEIAITKSRDFCMNVMNHLPGLVWSTNLFMECDYVNKGFLDFTGLKREKVLSYGWYEILHDNDKERFIRDFSESFEKQIDFEEMIQIKRRDGEYRWCVIRGCPCYDLNGHFIGYVGTLFDETEKRLADIGLRRYQVLSKHARDIILFIDINGQIIEGNESAVNAYGYTKEELLELTIFDLRHRNEIVVEQLFEAATNGFAFETIHFRKDGTSFPVEVSSQSTSLDGKTVLLSIIRDITERKKAEVMIKESQAKYRSLFMNITDIFVYGKIVSDRGNQLKCMEILEVNSAFNRLYGTATEQVVGKNGRELFPELSRYLKDKLGFSLHMLNEMNSIRIDEYYSESFKRWYSILIFEPEKGYLAAVASDISEKKINELELRKAKEAAEAANKAKSEFLANMSHEIRTPLNGMLGMIDLTMYTDLTAHQKENLSTAKLCANSLLNVINDILDFSKLEAGKLSFHNTNFNLRNLIEDTIKIHSIRAIDKGIELSHQMVSSIPQNLYGDPHRLQQVINNLISNAIKFTDRGEVLLKVRKGQDIEGKIELLFSVSDTGVGIEENDIKKLFNSFTQLDSTITRRHGGTGLGLVISKQLVEMMDGRIWVESKKGMGSEFSFTACLMSGKITNEQKSSELLVRKDSRYLKLLVVEDDSINQRVLMKLLQERGYNVDLATNGEEAVSMYITKKYDAVLMDIQMPEMDGIEATKKIREIERYYNSYTPILALTAFALQGDKERFLALGMDDYLAKPINKDELFEKLNNIATNHTRTTSIDGVTLTNNGDIVFVEKRDLQIADSLEAVTNQLFDLIGELELAVDSKQINIIEKLAHKIKELADSIDAYELKSSAFKVELAARRGDAEGALLNTLQLRFDMEIIKKSTNKVREK